MTLQEIRHAVEHQLPIELTDPMHVRASMPFTSTFAPLGFPLELTTNCAEIIAMAQQSWGGFEPRFDTPPLRLRVFVSDTADEPALPNPPTRAHGSLITAVADAGTYSVHDLAQGFTTISMSRSALEHPGHLRYFFLESAAMCQIAGRYTVAVHAGCVALDGNAVLLCGDSGAGKSTLSYACARAGWTYTTDDASFVPHDGPGTRVTGNFLQFRFRPATATLFPEIGGYPVTRKAEVGKPSVEMPTAAMENVQLSPVASVKHIVVLNRSQTEPQELVPFPAEALRYFIRQTTFGTREHVIRQTATIDRLLALGVSELRYHDLDWAIARLTQLVREGR